VRRLDYSIFERGALTAAGKQLGVWDVLSGVDERAGGCGAAAKEREARRTDEHVPMAEEIWNFGAKAEHSLSRLDGCAGASSG
jgi:hypothetical protein